MVMPPLLFIKIGLLAGLASWLSIAIINNIFDKNTNIYFIGEMLNMSALREDGILGQGLLYRACNNKKRIPFILRFIVIIQCIIASLLWFAAIVMFLTIVGFNFILALTIANWALFAFMLLWVGFLCGGLWY